MLSSEDKEKFLNLLRYGFYATDKETQNSAPVVVIIAIVLIIVFFMYRGCGDSGPDNKIQSTISVENKIILQYKIV
jgi:hypothetical protein